MTFELYKPTIEYMEAISMVITNPEHTKYLEKEMLDFIEENIQAIAQLLTCDDSISYLEVYDAAEDKINENAKIFVYSLRNAAAFYKKNWLILETHLENFKTPDVVRLGALLNCPLESYTALCCIDYFLSNFNDIISHQKGLSDTELEKIESQKGKLSVDISRTFTCSDLEDLYREICELSKRNVDFRHSKKYSLSSTFWLLRDYLHTIAKN